MIATLIISILTFVLITASILFFPSIKMGKIKIGTYWTIALVGAVILLCCNLAPIGEVFNQFTSNSAVNPLKILVLFFSMTIISILLDEFGLFRYLASITIKHAKCNQYVLFFSLYALTSILTIFTSNDIVILTLTPFICFFAKNAKINPIPYLIAEFAAANTWSLMFVIGNPTNIYLATSAGINFISYLKVMWLPTILGGLVELLIIFLLFRKALKSPISINEDNYVIPSKVDLIIGVVHLITCLVFLIISSYINLEMWLISLICASSLLVITLIMRLVTKKNWSFMTGSLKRLPYPLIPFFLSMCVIVVSFNYQGISMNIASFLSNSNPDTTIWIYGYSSFLSSNIINNIPMSILFSDIVSNLTDLTYVRAIYASIIGSNIGAFLTPIGALAGIMFTGLVGKHDVKFTFLDFLKYGSIISIPTITACLVGLLIMVR